MIDVEDSLPQDRDAVDLMATGERLVPGVQKGEFVVAEHLARYHWAGAFAAGREVLDAASGEGYGTDMMSKAGAASVIGIDVASDAVAHSLERYGHDYRQGDVAALPLDDASRDLVVSFETIEHVEEPAKAIDEFRRVLRADGVLVISTPNAQNYTVANEFHVRELEHDEFVQLLSARFRNVRIHLQQNLLTSVVLDEDSRASDGRVNAEFSTEVEIKPGDELYTIAVCSDADLPPAPQPVAVGAGTYEAHDLAERVVNAEGLVGEWSARAAEAERQLKVAEERAFDAESELYLIRRWYPTNAIPKAWRKLRRSHD